MTDRIDTEAMQQRLLMLMLEPVEMVVYDPAWPALYKAEEEYLWNTLPHDLVLHIEHIGSTDVPGLSAKPIDVQVGGRIRCVCGAKSCHA
ncbi:MAG: GrpB family protein [Flavobacteriales bacterium]|nr:GrpB family protein [Flavobacteriales bacterium]